MLRSTSGAVLVCSGKAESPQAPKTHHKAWVVVGVPQPSPTIGPGASWGALKRLSEGSMQVPHSREDSPGPQASGLETPPISCWRGFSHGPLSFLQPPAL